MENLQNDQVTKALTVIKNLADRCLKAGGIYQGFPEVNGVYQSISIIESKLNERTKRTRKVRADNTSGANTVPAGAILAGNIKAKAKEEKKATTGKAGGTGAGSGTAKRSSARIAKATTKKVVEPLQQTEMPLNGKEQS